MKTILLYIKNNIDFFTWFKGFESCTSQVDLLFYFFSKLNNKSNEEISISLMDIKLELFFDNKSINYISQLIEKIKLKNKNSLQANFFAIFDNEKNNKDKIILKASDKLITVLNNFDNQKELVIDYQELSQLKRLNSKKLYIYLKYVLLNEIKEINSIDHENTFYWEKIEKIKSIFSISKENPNNLIYTHEILKNAFLEVKNYFGDIKFKQKYEKNNIIEWGFILKKQNSKNNQISELLTKYNEFTPFSYNSLYYFKEHINQNLSSLIEKFSPDKIKNLSILEQENLNDFKDFFMLSLIKKLENKTNELENSDYRSGDLNILINILYEGKEKLEKYINFLVYTILENSKLKIDVNRLNNEILNIKYKQKKEIKEALKKELNQNQQQDNFRECVKCREGYLTKKQNKSTKQYFWSCDRYPECNFTCSAEIPDSEKIKKLEKQNTEFNETLKKLIDHMGIKI